MIPQSETFFQLILAVLLGGFVGLEREWKGKEAGLRTYSLVCLGATLFTIVAIESFMMFRNTASSFDPSRIVGQLVLGIGFLGAGLIIFREQHVAGLTTAAGLWVTTALGAAIGFRLYLLATFTALLAVFILSAFRLVEKRFLEPRVY